MKLTKTFVCLAIAGTMALTAIKAAAVPTPQLPLLKLNISGAVVFDDSAPDDNGKTTKAKATELKIDIKTLIELLNDSTNVQRTLSDLGLATQIPDGSYFVWNPGTSGLTITNSNGFSFALAGTDPVLTNSYSYASIQTHEEETVGMNFSQNDTTGAGSETDLTGIVFIFTDGVGDLFDSFGNGTLSWKFEKVDGGFQETTLKANLMPSNGYIGMVDHTNAMTLANFKVSGSGKGEVASNVFPFYLY